MEPVAVLSDVHLHDITAGWGLPGGGVDGLALRTWSDTSAAARAVNESLGALQAALAAIRARGIRHVVLPGDYSDDGQVLNVARLAAILDAHADLSFTLLPGNHDAWGLTGKHTMTRLALGPDRDIRLTSDPVLAGEEPGTLLSPDAFCPGLPQALLPLAAHGPFGKPQALHWETPFGTAPDPDRRSPAVPSPDGSVTARMLDASYLVEPVPGLWLLHLDVNVFEPVGRHIDPSRKRAFRDPAMAGWAAALRLRPWLLPWIADVAARAERGGKLLVGLSHYPAIDPYQDISFRRQILGEERETQVVPPPHVAPALARAGLRLILTGHLHTAGQVTVETPHGPLTQVAVPCPNALPPGFVVLHTDARQTAAVEWVSLAAVPTDPALAAYYRAAGAGSVAPTLGGFVTAQARRRFHRGLRRRWPAATADLAARASLADLTGLAEDAAVPLRNVLGDVEILRKSGPYAAELIPEPDLQRLSRLAATLPPAADPGLAAHFASLPPALERAGVRPP